MALTAEQVKQKARELGADTVGVASAAVLNAHPPDPKFPQTPDRISPEIKSVVAIVKRIPAGAFRTKRLECVQYIDQLVLREQDKICHRLAQYIENEGAYAFPLAAQETKWEYKKASYGYLSSRHVAIEAGLGTLGLELNLLTPEFGPRCYTSCVLTTAELEPDKKLTYQVCIGESCSRCLHSCPADAVLHWNIDKRACAQFAQEFGYSVILSLFQTFLREKDTEKRLALLNSPRGYAIWQGMLRVVGAFGDCPRCLEVCPVGDDYFKWLTDEHREIPEKTPEKVKLARHMQADRKGGKELPGLSAWNVRWVGEEGYIPPKKRERPAVSSQPSAAKLRERRS
jgi:epoxyqueuosine reductase QueG